MKRRYKFSLSYETGLAILGGFIIAFGVVCITRMFSPGICEMALSKLQSEFNIICNESVVDYIDFKEIGYSDLVDIQRDSNGNIQAINTNMPKVNAMKAELALSIQKKLDKIEEITVDFPTNGFFGIGGGFDVPVKLISVSSLEADLVSSFESVGINQTMLYINMEVQTKGKLLFFGEGQEVIIKTSVPVSQTVIVGEVPNTYVNVDKVER